MIIFLLFIVIIIALAFIKYSEKKHSKKKVFKYNKKNLYDWMNLTKKQRFDLSKEESLMYSNQRKDLLNKIRNEYKNISKNK